MPVERKAQACSNLQDLSLRSPGKPFRPHRHLSRMVGSQQLRRRHLRCALAATLCLGLRELPGTEAALLRGRTPEQEERATPPPPWRCFGGCEGTGKGCACEEGPVKVLASAVAPHQAGQASCTCTVEGEDCRCTGDCNEDAREDVCTQLLGPCQCTHFDEGICECNGYCHTKTHRAEACLQEAGCTWTGHWCEARVGLLWY
uniref:Uncharacterized protein n=1 Tax=Alexandrium monilatum TaxID=311494 RepID=A0A7S4W433_9DINO